MSILAAVLATASIVDGRTMRIPKSISLGLLAGGLVASLIRGAWLGHLGRPIGLFPASGPVVGVCDALLIALGGVVLGFLLFLALWALGVCGGGDVKLFAGISAWIDPTLVLLIMALSLILVCGWIMAVWAVMVVRRAFASGPLADRTGSGRVRGSRVSYSLPLAVATGLVLAVAWFDELVPSHGSTRSVAAMGTNAREPR